MTNNFLNIIKLNNINSYKEFKLRFPKKYSKAFDEGFLHSFGLSGKLPSGYWGLKALIFESKRHYNFKEYRKALTGGAIDSLYSIEKENPGFIDKKIRKHMELTGNRYNRLIYTLYFEKEKAFYTGLTSNIRSRIRQHLFVDKGVLFDFVNKNGYDSIIDYLLKNKNNTVDQLKTFLKKYDIILKISKKTYSPKEAQVEEVLEIKRNEKKGWLKINKSKGGALGGTVKKWGTLESVLKEASKYNKKSHFEKGSSGAFKAAKKNKKKGWMSECEKLWEPVKKPNGYWKENVPKIFRLAKECKSKTEFNGKHPSAYSMAKELGIFDEVCSHMAEKEKIKGYWTEEKFKIFFSKCKNLNEARNNNPKLYAAYKSFIKRLDKDLREKKRIEIESLLAGNK